MGYLAIITILVVLMYWGFYFSGWVMDEANKDFHNRIDTEIKSIKKQYLKVCELEGWDVKEDITVFEMKIEIAKFQKKVKRNKNK